MRKIEIKVLILIVAFFVLLSNANESYARYISSVSSSTSADFKTWKLFVNNTDVTSNYSTTMNFTPSIISKSGVNSNKFAPGSSGYFDIYIDPTGINLSYYLNCNIEVTSEINNFKVIGYSLLFSNNPTTVPALSFETSNHTYPDTNFFSVYRKLPSGGHQKYYIRIFFKWIDGYNNESTNESDTIIGNKAFNGDEISYNILVTLTFKQNM